MDQAEWSLLWRSPVARPLRFRAKDGPQPGRLVKEWSLQESNHGPCQICRDIDAANPDPIPYEQRFADGHGGFVDDPPPGLHVNCRCRVDVYAEPVEPPEPPEPEEPPEPRE
jgi:hypothetical protein